MIYCDTSFVATLVLREAASDEVEAFVQQVHPGDLAVSHWVHVEFASLLARRVRLRELTARQAREIHREFDRMLDESFEVFVPNAGDYSLAVGMLQHYKLGLRAGDALHLAIASNRQVARFLTLDRALIRAARALKLPADSGIEH